MLQRKYKASKSIWYDPTTQRVYATKYNMNCVNFDSKGEFDCYLLLKRYIPSTINLTLHNSVNLTNKLKWKVDFTLSATCQMDLIWIANLLSLTTHNQVKPIYSRAFIEYKGVLDNNFLAKVDHILLSNFEKQLILVSDNEHGIRLEDPTNLIHLTKPFYSITYLTAILKRIMQ